MAGMEAGMHTRTIGGVNFIFNPDLSGDVTIQADDKEVSVPGVALMAFISELTVSVNDDEDDWRDSIESVGPYARG
jgi:hypothetical protein